MKFLIPFSILPFDKSDCECYGVIRAYLQKRGTPIGPYDLLIAAQSLSRNFTLVTNNVTEFERVPSLNIENWVLLSWQNLHQKLGIKKSQLLLSSTGFSPYMASTHR